MESQYQNNSQITVRTSYVGYTIVLIIILIVLAYMGWSKYYELEGSLEPEEKQTPKENMFSKLTKSAVGAFAHSNKLDDLEELIN